MTAEYLGGRYCRQHHAAEHMTVDGGENLESDARIVAARRVLVGADAAVRKRCANRLSWAE
jgi:hypothetical protein